HIPRQWPEPRSPRRKAEMSISGSLNIVGQAAYFFLISVFG
ncbi:MAG: hypothetical protein ACJAS1_006977, partial [Oleiphilaceae bacterium]